MAGGACLQQGVDDGRCKAGLAQHFVGVLAQARRHGGRHVGLLQAHRIAGKAVLAAGRALQRHEEADALQVRIGLQVFQPVHGRGRNLQPLAQGKPVRGVVGRDDARLQFVQRLDVPGPRRDVGKARVPRQVGAAGGVEEIAPMGVRVGHQADVSVGGLAGPAPRRQHPRITGLAGRIGQVAAVVMLHQRKRRHAFEHGHFQLLAPARALALEQRGQDGVRGDQAASLVGGDGGQVARRARLAPDQVGKSGQALDDVVVSRAAIVGAAFAKAIQARIHQPRMARAQRGGVQPQRGHLGRPHAVHQHVGLVNQRQQRLARGRLLQVQHDAALVAVQPQEDRGQAGLLRGAGAPGGIAAGRFDLDDVRPVVGQDLRGIGAEHDGGQVQDADAVQRRDGRGGRRGHGGNPIGAAHTRLIWLRYCLIRNLLWL